MEQTELTYIVRINTHEDSPKVRRDFLTRLEKICGLNFLDAEVDDANGD
jgi:hypothetical protein